LDISIRIATQLLGALLEAQLAESNGTITRGGFIGMIFYPDEIM
jgi:hypothetical protein